MLTYLGLFVSAFVAATLIPFYSEVVLVAALNAGYPALALWATASVGNTLGAVVNGALGRLLTGQRLKRWAGLSDRALEKAEKTYRRWGQWSLLMGWLPIGGDALTVIGGMFRVPWPKFITLVFIGKAGRYAVVIWLATRISGS